jgi:hypothetical protein
MAADLQFSPSAGVRPPLIITGCSSRKRRKPEVSDGVIPRLPQAEVSSRWRDLVANASPVCRARDLYAGRAFALALEAAQIIGADVAIISAGLGIVMASTEIPSYDLTLGRGGIRSRITGTFDLSGWWRDVIDGPYSTDLASQLNCRPLVMACLSQAYAPLIMDLLDERCDKTEIRVFGQGLQSVLPARIAKAVMPYDDRLTKVSSGGTKTDFAQRALNHYVREILPKTSRQLAEERDAVCSALAGVTQPPAVPTRAKADDEQIRRLISNLIRIVGPKKSTMLRYLRDKEGVACEQGRFAKLFAEVVGH